MVFMVIYDLVNQVKALVYERIGRLGLRTICLQARRHTRPRQETQQCVSFYFCCHFTFLLIWDSELFNDKNKEGSA